MDERHQRAFAISKNDIKFGIFHVRKVPPAFITLPGQFWDVL
jgi:hypothetical protein